MNDNGITNEMLKDAIHCQGQACTVCSLGKTPRGKPCVEILAQAFLAEREAIKPVRDGWADAPANAESLIIAFYNSVGKFVGYSNKYTRELPKSRIDLIAEKYTSDFWQQGNRTQDRLTAQIKAAILEAME